MMGRKIKIRMMLGLLLLVSLNSHAIKTANYGSGVRIKNLVRVVGVRDNQLTGYGIVSGLAGTGDSSRNRATRQSVANVLKKYGLNLSPTELYSRNVAVVMVTATLPAFSRPGDKLDVNVSSVGDARSLTGGTLMRMHLTGPDGKIYALAQGPLITGAYKHEYNSNIQQKNHPTSAVITNGAIIEAQVPTSFVGQNGNILLKLHSPDFTTSRRIVNRINASMGYSVARALDAGTIEVQYRGARSNGAVDFISRIEGLRITPDNKARVVVNERTGSVVTGGDVKISAVSITHGDVKISVTTDFSVSQPDMLIRPGSDIRTAVIPDTAIRVRERKPVSLHFKKTITVAHLVSALNKVKTSTRDIISILQTMKRAGALHAELIIQ